MAKTLACHPARWTPRRVESPRVSAAGLDVWPRLSVFSCFFFPLLLPVFATLLRASSEFNAGDMDKRPGLRLVNSMLLLRSSARRARVQ